MRLLDLYKGKQPFSLWLKEYFRTEKKFGSRDRRQISHLCYCCFRLGHYQQAMAPVDRVLLGLYLCSDQPNPVLEATRSEWLPHLQLAIPEKLRVIGLEPDESALFPLSSEVSDKLPVGFFWSHFVQPSLFLRIRPGNEAVVPSRLRQAGIAFQPIDTHALALETGSKLEEVIEADRQAVIQDLSSQRVTGMLNGLVFDEPQVWDCCAASGGKSILLRDTIGRMQLTVSDVRQSILHSLSQRFQRAGMGKFDSHVCDLSKAAPASFNKGQLFDLVLADVPCSGSGTWGRAPEHLVSFVQPELDQYVALQQGIVRNSVPFVRTGGYYLYITCSVYRRENEDRLLELDGMKGMKRLSHQYFTGHADRADTMFAALYQRIA